MAETIIEDIEFSTVVGIDEGCNAIPVVVKEIFEVVVIVADVVSREGLTAEGVMLVGVTELVLLILGDELVADFEVLLLEVVELIEAVLLLVVRVESVLNEELDEKLVS